MPSRHQFWFTPWCEVTSPFTIGPVTFWPGDAALKKAPVPVRKAARLRLRQYRAIDGDRLPTPGILALGTDPFRVVTDEEAELLRSAGDVASLLAVASSDDFRHGHDYRNSTHLTVVQQNFTPDSEYIAVGGRRRFGQVSDGGYLVREVRFHAAVEASRCRFDGGARELRDALTAAWDDPLSVQIRSAAWWFRAATSDAPSLGLSADVKLLSTALEALCKRPGMVARASVADALGRLFPPDRTSRPGWDAWSQRRGQAPQVAARPTWTALQFWSNDFFHLRNALEHDGRDTRPQFPSCPSWTGLRAVLIGINVFPLLVRGLLAEAGGYTWTEDDFSRLDFLEGLVEVPGFRMGGAGDWQACVKEASDASFTRVIRRLVDAHGLGAGADEDSAQDVEAAREGGET